MMKNIPSKEDMSCHGMLEEEYAISHFYGKSVEEASELFFINSEYYGGDFRWMSVKGFFYYINSIKKYLLSEEGEDDHLFIGNVINIIMFRLKEETDFGDAFKNHKKDILDIFVTMKIIIEKKNFHLEHSYCVDLLDHVSTIIELCRN